MPKITLAAKSSVFLLIICLSTSITVGWISYISSKNSLQTQTFDRLTAIQAAKTDEIERYFEQTVHQIQVISENPNTINAVEQFSAAVQTLNNQPIDQCLQRADGLLAKFYRDDFLPRVSSAITSGAHNPQTETASTSALMPKSAAAIHLQHHYIAANPNITGEKHRLKRAEGDTSEYANVHATYHPIFRSFLDKLGFYDIFLIDSQSGDVVYSVYKETDFGTSLTSGPYADTNIVRAFRLANRADSHGAAHFVDFEPYRPSLDAPAAFIATPITRGQERLGVLVFQIPVNRINEIMTSNGEWLEHGLGESGEIYLVGPDFTMRSASRFYEEDPAGYVETLRELGYPQQKLDQLTRYATSILNQSVNTDAALFALAGDRGTKVIRDYRKIDALSSYGPINFGEQQWAVIAEMDAAEAFAPVAALQKTIAIWTLSIAWIAVALGIWAAHALTAPLVALTEAAKVVGTGGHVDPLPHHSRDEVGELTDEFNQMVSNLREQQVTIDRQTAENYELLLNVLPEPIANRLKNGEVHIADAFPSVSVLFADIVGFTEMSRGVPPITILRMLDDLFGAFDQKALELGVEKIKTIGDSYMAVCGLPHANDAHADQIAKLAFAILQCLAEFNNKNGTHLKMRIGAHSGAVVAGVIGTSKYIYDLWGDTVNMASRMESTGIPDQIQISKAFRDQLVTPLEMDFRGSLEVKGAGLVDTYLLNQSTPLAA